MGNMVINPDAMREYERITQENIDLDIQKVLNAAINTEGRKSKKDGEATILRVSRI